MNNGETKQLCLSLLRCDSEEEVIQILKNKGLWDNKNYWRYYGDDEANYSTIGTQQSRPEASIVEKIINSIDARLMNECLVQGIDPTSDQAPHSIKDAVAEFFEGRKKDCGVGGGLQFWDKKKLREEANNITVAVTGSKKSPCITIADLGEGQSPDSMPNTILSLRKGNKLNIMFVQGQYNQGGSGALCYCGRYGIQLVISKRNPQFRRSNSKCRDEWGFTIVRRERPSELGPNVKNSIFSYLAPIDSGTSRTEGKLFRFSADSLTLMPKGPEPYEREMPWGTLIKLYNYEMKGYRSNVLRKDGLLSRLEALIPQFALPVRIHECRDFGGIPERSFDNTMSGVSIRLSEDKLEHGFPSCIPFEVFGQKMVARIYVLKKDKDKEGKADTYVKKEAVLITVNGQTLGYLPKSFFSRAKVKMGRLADSMLVIVDCSDLSRDWREDLYMANREQRKGEFQQEIEGMIEEIVSRHELLRELCNRRSEEEIENRIADSKPLEEVLQSIIKSSPTLSRLFLSGQRLSNPYNPTGGDRNQGETGKGIDRGQEKGEGEKPFVGKPHPTYFRFYQKKYGYVLSRTIEQGRTCRLKFETDVENNYFDRLNLKGQYTVTVDGIDSDTPLHKSFPIIDGIANLSICLPEDIEVHKKLTVTCKVFDELNPDGFTNTAIILVIPPQPHQGGQGSRLHKHEDDARKSEGQGNSAISGITFPTIIEVTREGWNPVNKFDDISACTVITENSGAYTFYINMDNKYLLTEMKYHKSSNPKILKSRFKFGNVLLGLAVLYDHNCRSAGNNDNDDADNNNTTPEDRVSYITRATSPFLLGMIEGLGAISEDDILSLAQIGDDS